MTSSRRPARRIVVVLCALTLAGAASLFALPRWLAAPRAPAPPGPWASAFLGVSAELGDSGPALAAAFSSLDELAAKARARHATAGENWPDTLGHVLFQEASLTREIHENDPRFFRLASVLSGRRGNCLGLVALYLALAERVGVPMDAVRVPGHVFVRTRESPPRNLEMLRAGEAMSDDWYRARYGPWSPSDEGYARPLSLAELEALFWYDAGGFHLVHGRAAEAAAAFSRASTRAPRFAEAAASLMATRQLFGTAALEPPAGGLRPTSTSVISLDPTTASSRPHGAVHPRSQP